MTYDVKDWRRYDSEDSSAKTEMTINVMRDSYADLDRWDKAYDAVSGALKDIHNNTGLITSVYKIDTDAKISCSHLRDDAEAWLDNNDIYWTEGFLWIIGDCDDTFIAVGYSGAWSSRRNAFLGDHVRDGDHAFEQSAIHEALHTYLYSDFCDEIQREILNYDTSDNSLDHDLGQVRKDDYETTPMLGFYGQNEAENGDCDNYWTIVGRSHELSDCTYWGLELSQEHSNSNHNQ